jgi:phospholipid/cholesterol/gamma-HCH transport system substrate-binding protein
VKAFTERKPKVIGTVAIAVMTLIVAAVIFLNRGVFQSGYPVSARFRNAAGISKGTKVLLAGVDVGTVGSVTLGGNGVDVAMTINHGVVLPHHTAADIEVETLLGQVDVTLDPVSGWHHPLRPGAVLTDTSVPTEFYQLNNVAGHLLEHSNAKALNELVEDLAAITKGKQRQVAEIIQGLGKLTTTVSDRSAEVSQLIDSSNVLAGVLAQHDHQLATTIGNLNTVAAGLADHSAQLADLIDNVEAMAGQTNGLLGQDKPQIDSLIKNLTTTLGVVDGHQDDLAQAVSYLGAAIKGFSSIGYSGSTPLTWANIYVGTTGMTGTAGVLGSCGAFTAALDDALGPTPLPCATRTGEPSDSGLAYGSGTSGSQVSGSPGSSRSSGSSGSLGVGGVTPSAAPDTGISGLSELLAPLAGGS